MRTTVRLPPSLVMAPMASLCPQQGKRHGTTTLE